MKNTETPQAGPCAPTPGYYYINKPCSYKQLDKIAIMISDSLNKKWMERDSSYMGCYNVVHDENDYLCRIYLNDSSDMWELHHSNLIRKAAIIRSSTKEMSSFLESKGIHKLSKLNDDAPKLVQDIVKLFNATVIEEPPKA